MRQLNLALGVSALAVMLGVATQARAQSSGDYTTYYQWDSARRMTMKVGPMSAAGTRQVEQYGYDADGQLTLVRVGSATGVTVTTSGVVTGVPGWVNARTTELRHDAVGNPAQVYTYPTATAPIGASATSTSSLSQTSYDADDRPVCKATRMQPSRFPEFFAALPDPCVIQSNGDDGPDRITKTLYDGAGQVTDILQAFGVKTASGYPETVERTYVSYSYTPSGKQQTLTDANKNKTTLTYDAFDRLSAQYFPSTVRGALVSNSADYEAYEYDLNGNRTKFHKRDGTILRYCYDLMNREIIKRPRDDTSCATVGEANDVYTSYDLAGHRTSARYQSTAGGGVILTYDSAGRVISETTFGRKLKYGYENAGNRKKITWPESDLYASTLDYDPVGNLTAVGTSAGVLTFGYDSLGRRASIVRPGHADTAYGYDDADRLSSLTQSLGPATNVWGFAYSPASQIKTRSTTNSAYVWSTWSTSLTATADGLNRDGAIAATNGYDGSQNLTKDRDRVFTYDAENRLIGMTTPSYAAGGAVVAALQYDPLGRLFQTSVQNTAGTSVTQFLYAGDALVAEYDGAASTPLRRYVHGAGVDEPLIWFEGSDFSTPRYLHADNQGSVVAWSNGAGVSQATYAYGPYGEPGDNWAAGSRFRYTGQAALPELKLYHYKARAYDPIRGWFLQTDPIGYKDDLALYAYTGNDPVNRSDPTGMAQICVEKSCVWVDGDGDTLIDDADDLTGPQIDLLARDFRDFILQHPGKNLQTDGAYVFGAGEKDDQNMVRAASQFAGAAMKDSALASKWQRVSYIEVLENYSANTPAPSRSGGFNNSSNMYIEITGNYQRENGDYYKSPSNMARIIMHETNHNAVTQIQGFWENVVIHGIIDAPAVNLLKSSGLDGGGCVDVGFGGC